MKYSINGTGNIVAERDIYSLGGFIPKNSVGAKVANEDQISQDGDCWVASGDISGRPDVRIKDNAYVGTFPPGAEAAHTDGVTEFSGNTLIPGIIWVRSLATEAKNNVFIKDSFIGISMDVVCGPKIRMYDNAVLSRNLIQEGEIVLQGDAVMGYDFNSGSCMCSNGHSDAIIKLP